MSRDALHELIDRLPEAELAAAQRFLEYLAINPAYRAALSAPEGDEPVTEADAAGVIRSQHEAGSGLATPHDEILREFGLR
jgi:hypothetical protein